MMIRFGTNLIILLLKSPTTSSFVLPSKTHSAANTWIVGTGTARYDERSLSYRASLTRRFAGLDDDEEDDDDDFDDKGPLANGIDSVSWLPSVDGAKGDNMPIDSAKEVRYRLEFESIKSTFM